jgi:geranylgeranyl pyrophosphate synthase
MTSGSKHNTASEGTQSLWLELPGLCCKALDGDRTLVEGISAAWSMLYTAAHLMDSIEDRDELDSWWANFGSPGVINTATGLYALSTSILIESVPAEIHQDTRLEILTEFQQTIIKMCSGQHIDIMSEELSLDEYWQVADLKSGSFFGLACFTGARVAVDETFVHSRFRDFGRHLGVLIQISDDTKDVWSLLSNNSHHIKKPLCLLPIVYTMMVESPENRSTLSQVFEKEHLDRESIACVSEILDNSGAGLYVLAKSEEHRFQAHQALVDIGIHESMYNRLIEIIDRVCLLSKV